MDTQVNFIVLGTKCASCEIVLERELKHIPGVRSVKASHDAGRISFDVEKGTVLTPAMLEAVVGKHGYRFQALDGRPAPTGVDFTRVGGAIVLVIALYILMKQTGLLMFSPGVEGPTSLGAVFVVGLVAAFSSCTAVVGGLVVAVSSSMAKANPNLTVTQKLKPHLFFNLGRLIGFSIFGAMIGWLGSMISLTPAWNGALVILIALMMILIGINLLDVLPQSFNPIRPPKWLAHRIHAMSSSPNPGTAFLLGAFTFFLPCGFTQSMQLYAVSLADPAQAALTMFVFALGTLPALLSIGAVTAASKGKTLQMLSRAAGAFVIVLGISNVQNGAALLDVRLPGRVVSQDMGAAVLVDGKQLVQMEVTPYGIYSPDVITVQEGIPVRWEIWGANVMGCASNLVLPAFGVDTVLEPGDNTVEFTPDRSGTFTYSCSMGMVRGTMIVEPQI